MQKYCVVGFIKILNHRFNRCEAREVIWVYPKCLRLTVVRRDVKISLGKKHLDR